MSGTHSLDQYIASGITLTSGGAYLTPFTVTSSGTIDSASIGLYGITLAPYLLNEGTITGQTAAVSLALGGTIDNTGTIYGSVAAYRAAGATGIILGGGTLSLTGTGTVSGGTGFSSPAAGGDGGIGASVAATAYLDNTSTITGGGGGGTMQSGAGGAGAYIAAGASLNNAGGVISGGAGGAGAYGGGGVEIASYDTFNANGLVLISAGSLSNSGTILGGAGRPGDASVSGGIGGYGVKLDELVTFTNAGTISGGAAGDGASQGMPRGGAGAAVGDYARFYNNGRVVGGGGGGGDGGYGASDVGGYVANTAVILGGAGGTDGSGGDGVGLELGSLVNTGSIAGGFGGEASLGFGLTVGSDGVLVFTGSNIDNAGNITGGGAAYGQVAGAGIELLGIFNVGLLSLAGTGTVTGGLGYSGGTLAGAGGAGAAAYGANGTLINGAPGSSGNTIIGGAGGAISGYGYAGSGGAGVMLGATTMVNYGSVSGGTGGYSQTYSGYGGVGADLYDAAVLMNFGVISGGEAGDGLSHPGYSGGGAYIGSGASLTNAGLLLGGAGMSNGVTSSAGGYGAYLLGGYLANLAGGTVRGGNGGGSTAASGGGDGVAIISSGSLINSGAIYGGNGGYGGTSGNGGAAGIGLVLDAQGTFTNAGTIGGGTGGAGGIYGGYGGPGVEGGLGTLINQALLLGGAGGAGPGGSGGAGVLFGDGEVINTGTILGGAGGANGGAAPGLGGFAMQLVSGSLNNSGNITGGQGGTGAVAGPGGDGILAVTEDFITNTGTIAGANARDSGLAGTGIYVLGDLSLTGAGIVTGGAGYSGQGGGYGITINAYSAVYNGGAGMAGNLILGGNGGAYVSGPGNGGDGGAGALLARAAYLYNAGTIAGGDGGASMAGNQGSGGNGVDLSGGTLWNAGTIAGGFGFGGQADAVYFKPGTGGVLTVSPHAVFEGLVVAHYTAGDILALTGAGTLNGFGSEFTGFDTLAFEPGAQWDAVGNTLAFGDATIDGFGRLDTLDLGNLAFVAAESLSLSANTLSIVEAADTLDVTFANADAPYGFTITSDGAGGTDVNAICYVRGTRILTPTGEVAIENLAIGDVLVTRFGGMRRIRWIGRQNFDWRFVRHNPAKIPVRIAPGALAEGIPARELAVSPGHSLLLGNTLVLARDLVNGVTVTQEAVRDRGVLEYFQIELDSHDCVVAEGCWAESYADAPGQRAAFHNAASYHALYPEAPPPDGLELCAERPERGAKLAAALRPVVARAWAGLAPGPLEGWLERVTDWRVEGWALDTAHPALPVILEVWLGERLLGTALAAGKGRTAFSFASPVRLRPEDRVRLSIRRAGDGAELPKAQGFKAGKPFFF